MSVVSVDIIPAVDNILDEFGDTTVFTRVTPGAFVPATGALGSGSTTTYTAKGISDNFNMMEIQSGLIEFSDMKYIIRPKDGSIPAVNDTCSIGGITYRVMSVRNDNLQGSTYLFTLQLRV